MNNALLIIGEDIKINQPFLNYIFENYMAKFGELGDIKFIEKNDKNMPLAIQNLAKKYSSILIFSSDENYHLVAKIIATLTSDILELKFSQTLAPSMSKLIKKDSFLIVLDGCEINLVKVNPLQKLPEILINDTEKSQKFFIFADDLEDLREYFEPICAKFDIDLSLSKFSKFLILASAKERKFGKLVGFIDEVLEVLSNQVIMEENLAKFIVEKLKAIGAKISFAESCTAGLIASKIGEISGASEVFDGSLVTYSNQIKHIWLDVSEDVLEEFGAVSKECVIKMIDGAIEASGANFALAVSGIAGPTGGSEQKPVGTVFIGAGSRNGKKLVDRFFIQGDRNYIRNESVNIAFSMLLKLKPDLFFRE
ncbi:CinA family protein [Campylobacter geochelonis]|uniref:Competence/damage-inducible domain-containing protein n=1 Tax=Campylobacter geochelonis TaxID=1780362 RepID=A0A128EFX4_9BACT|nr:CinA family protein [Campylobacter geochelonis]QKF70847.1 NMN amidohydrolase [Campylobacter geochelonis]CZE47461.1 competence/damage-inducible domain-containing protein [Campylobacter geochelonis]CZE48022.1 competence/damage-inducible domain-containing protein [Campylobacter geochelonis]CZE50612.1 competence/damage-inducible domain-containing protein [Campylobacter geochelonis]